jgi:glycosyltransferase involved in cell wall biosynthesis
VCNLTEDYLRWFYGMANKVAVPTTDYMQQLQRRGIAAAKMVRFGRGIDTTVFTPKHNAAEVIAQHYNLPPGFTLLYCGRISKEKNMDFLAEVYKRLCADHKDMNLILAGDGPYFHDFFRIIGDLPRVRFAGRIGRRDLPLLYSGADCLVFPSVTDTFGMVVLEAQACGLPVVVSDAGGPQEIIENGKTGFITKAGDIDDWVNKISGMNHLKEQYTYLYEEMKINAQLRVKAHFDWNRVLRPIFETTPQNAAERNASGLDVHLFAVS